MESAGPNMEFKSSFCLTLYISEYLLPLKTGMMMSAIFEYEFVPAGWFSHSDSLNLIGGSSSGEFKGRTRWSAAIEGVSHRRRYLRTQNRPVQSFKLVMAIRIQIRVLILFCCLFQRRAAYEVCYAFHNFSGKAKRDEMRANMETRRLIEY